MFVHHASILKEIAHLRKKKNYFILSFTPRSTASDDKNMYSLCLRIHDIYHKLTNLL